jgi:hypothetical protein
MAKKKVFVSFDYENDKRYKFLLEAWDKNSEFDFTFDDRSSGEINSWSIPVVKAALTKKINSATYTFVIIGEEANKQHKDHKDIGFKNWINFEVNRSKLNKNKLLAIKLDKSYESPDELMGVGASWAYSFTEDAIMTALKNL